MQRVKNLPGERWKRIKETQYWISNKGRLITTTWKGSNQQRFFKPAIDQGYYRTVLIIQGLNISVRIHRLVAQYFVHNPDPETLVEVNHKDFNRLNNDYRNLEWVTKLDNIQHAIDGGRMKSMPGSKNGFSKLTEKQVVEIRSKYKPHHYTRDRLAKEYGVTVACIKDVLYRRWKHVTNKLK